MKKMVTVVLMALTLFAVSAAVADSQADAVAAAAEKLPGATVDYAVRERDDKAYVWKVFYHEGADFGVCTVMEDTGKVHKIEIYVDQPEGMLSAGAVIDALTAQKGAVTITEFNYDWDDRTGTLRYEGEAELDGKRYEFEIGADGTLLEWKRD